MDNEDCHQACNNSSVTVTGQGLIRPAPHMQKKIG